MQIAEMDPSVKASLSGFRMTRLWVFELIGKLGLGVYLFWIEFFSYFQKISLLSLQGNSCDGGEETIDFPRED